VIQRACIRVVLIVIRLPVTADFSERFHRFFMADVVNLRTERKRTKRRQAEQEAAAHRLAYGQSKAERNLKRSQSDKAQRSLDQHRIETGDES
jgi:hypothetical protein